MKRVFGKLEHIGIKTYDIEKAIRFYTNILGFTLIQRIKPGKNELVFLKLEELLIELIEVNDGTVYADGLVHHLALQVTDMQEAMKLLEEQGVEIAPPGPRDMGDGRVNLFFRGPSGEKIEIISA